MNALVPLQRQVVRARNYRLENSAIVAGVIAILVWLCSGCAVEDEPRVYTCTILYRCAGATDVSARFALPCASSEDEAEDKVDALVPEAVSCPETWQYTRVSCETYEPFTKCP